MNNWIIVDEIVSETRTIDAVNYDTCHNTSHPIHVFQDKEIIFRDQPLDSDIIPASFNRVMEFMNSIDRNQDARITARFTSLNPGVSMVLQVWSSDKEIIDAVRDLF